MLEDKRLGHWEVGPNRILLWDPTGRDPIESPCVPGSHVFLICLDPIVAHRAEIEARKAGLEIRDTMVWFRGQQPPVTVVVGRKPLEGTVAFNVLKWRTGALNVDATRVPANWDLETSVRKNHQGKPCASNGFTWTMGAGSMHSEAHPLGRWPVNVLHDGSAEVLGEFPVTTSGSRAAGVRKGIGFRGGVDHKGGDAIEGDTGSAARFFHTIPDLEALVNHLTALVAKPS